MLRNMVNQRALVSRLQALQDSERSYLQVNAKQASQTAELRLARRCQCWTKPACAACQRWKAQAHAGQTVTQVFENSGKRLREMQAEKSIQENRLWREANVEHQRVKSMEDFLQKAGTILQTKQDSVKYVEDNNMLSTMSKVTALGAFCNLLYLCRAMSAKLEKLAAQQAELAEEQQARNTTMTDLALHLVRAGPCSEPNTKVGSLFDCCDPPIWDAMLYVMQLLL